MKKMRIDVLACILLALLLTLASCSGPGSVVGSTPTNTTVPSPVPVATSTPLPVRDRILLVAPEIHADLNLQSLSDFLAEQSLLADGTFERVSSAASPQMDAALALMVFVDQPELAEEWARLNPEVQVITIPGPGGELPLNMIVLGGDEIETGQIGFLAGYAASLLAPDWRTAIISDVDSSHGDEIGNAFYQGGKYFCGLCRPERPPYEDYPLILDMIPEDEASWQRVRDILISGSVDVIFIEPGVLSSSQAEDLDSLNIQRISSGWEAQTGGAILSITFDATSFLADHWEDILTQPMSGVYPLGLRVDPGDQGLVSAGRAEVIQEVMEDLEEGYIGINE